MPNHNELLCWVLVKIMCSCSGGGEKTQNYNDMEHECESHIKP
jgi:hypothetical protein